jgi:hypothetical protein
VKEYILSVLAVTLCSNPSLANVMTDHLVGTRGGNKLPYKLSLPDDYKKNKKKYPVLVGLHHYGGQGTDLKAVGLTGGTGWQERFIYIAPQCPPGKTWDEPLCVHIKAIIDYEKTKLRIDGDRICVTGMSMGGFATYAIVNLYPKYFAAANPIVGHGNWIKAPKLKNVPFWSFVTVRDPIVPIAACRTTVDKLQKAGAYVRSTVFTGLPHRLPSQYCWKHTFIFDWMYAQKRGTPHNYHLRIVGGSLKAPSNKNGDGFFEPKTKHRITARAPDRTKDEVFTGWTSTGGMGQFWFMPDGERFPAHKSTTHPIRDKGKFANAKALTTTFTMPANDVIVTANYKIDPNYKPPPAGVAKPTPSPKRTNEEKAQSQLRLAKNYIESAMKAKALVALKKLIDKYPNTEAAKVAARELKKLGGK